MRLTLVIAAVLLAAPAALAWHPPTYSCRSEGVVEITEGPEGRTFYLDLHEEALEHGVLVYEETNGFWHAKPAGVYRDGETRADLQRGPSPYIPNDDAMGCPDEMLLMPDVLFI